MNFRGRIRSFIRDRINNRHPPHNKSPYAIFNLSYFNNLPYRHYSWNPVRRSTEGAPSSSSQDTRYFTDPSPGYYEWNQGHPSGDREMMYQQPSTHHFGTSYMNLLFSKNFDLLEFELTINIFMARLTIVRGPYRFCPVRACIFCFHRKWYLWVSKRLLV